MVIVLGEAADKGAADSTVVVERRGVSILANKISRVAISMLVTLAGHYIPLPYRLQPGSGLFVEVEVYDRNECSRGITGCRDWLTLRGE